MRLLISCAFVLVGSAGIVGLSGCILPMGVSPCQPNPAHELLTEINRVRVQEGIPPVRPNRLLAEAAQGHATLLAAGEGDGHHGPDGSTPLDRISEVGYRPQAFGENIAFGAPSAKWIVLAWMNSPGHRQILLDSTYDEVGLGGVITRDRPIWVANFGARKETATGRCHPWPIH